MKGILYIDCNDRFRDDWISCDFMKLPHDELGFIELNIEIIDGNIVYNNKICCTLEAYKNNIKKDSDEPNYFACYMVEKEFENDETDVNIWINKDGLMFDDVRINNAWICMEILL